ncbi:MAG: T9SS type A sorting domain-containing protein [Ignavibacteria bacterium]|nr:T9SS type A sorting domain-containing protein [Ignavibacteria bacterium]
MIAESTDRKLWEVNSAGSVVWSFSPGVEVTRVLRYPMNYSGLVGVQNTQNTVPDKFELSQNFPNPFNPSTDINYSLPKSSDVSLIVYDILGNEIRTLVNEANKNSGSYSVNGDGTNDAGMKVSWGVYYYKFKTGNFIQVRKMLLIK